MAAAALWDWLAEWIASWYEEAPITYQEKDARIQACLALSPVNLWELRELALSSGGLLECTFLLLLL